MDLTNKWMNDPQYLAQIGHFLGGCLTIVLAAFFWGMPAVWAIVATDLVAAGFKEFWYDLKYELPKQTLWDSVEDFAFYALGIAAGVGLAYLKLRRWL